jgi:predicted AlkP superfamily phosphohydrolase/phosphomutase
MSKVFIFGIDGLDKDMLIKYKNQLPNFSTLIDTSPNVTLESVHPPDSHTAWASIYTGLNPAQHGMLDFVDPLEKSKILAAGEIDNSIIRRKTFWDIAGDQGIKVCIVFPHLGYPPWEVNGIMISRSSMKDDILSYPETIMRKYEANSLNVLKVFPKRNKLDEYILKANLLIDNEYKFSTELMEDVEWDLFFTYSSTLDWIEHYFWGYYADDSENKYKTVILDFYKEYDRVLGGYRKKLNFAETTVIVLSDHGHGMRPLKVVNLNEVLRQKGFLRSRIKEKKISDPLFLFEKLKKFAVHIIVKYGLGGIAQKIIVVFPMGRRIYTAPISINWKDTIAYVSDLSGIKAYSYGGIKIVRENLDEEDYEELRDKLIEEILSLKNPDSGEKFFRWIKKREDLYQGEFINKYPDIIFDLKEGYGAGWSLYEDLITDAPTSNLVPGSHKIDTTVFLCSGSSKEFGRECMMLIDIAPTVLDILGIKENFRFDGRSILANR